ncbi:hypothetical protein [Pikeienuella sp. HZG-20]|uniref:hypothetical protein n=1 Tax=Paludibacillus litoralis TaxID=3133267 RepID=UPI0030ED44F3
MNRYLLIAAAAVLGLGAGWMIWAQPRYTSHEHCFAELTRTVSGDAIHVLRAQYRYCSTLFPNPK